MRRINNFFSWLANNVVILLLASATGILSYFTDLREALKNFLNWVGIQSNFIIDILSVCLLILFFMSIFSILKSYIDRKNRKKLSIYDSNVGTVLWADASGERIREFQELRADAKKSMLVMGVGMTFFSQDLRNLETLLDENLTVRLLMIDPRSITDATAFNNFFSRPGYDIDVRTSYDRLVNYISNRSKNNNRKGRVFLKTYSYLLPMNVTVIDERTDDSGGRMLIEWCFPFSDWRLSSRFSRIKDGQMFDTIMRNIEDLWINSRRVASDFTQQGNA